MPENGQPHPFHTTEQAFIYRWGNSRTPIRTLLHARKDGKPAFLQVPEGVCKGSAWEVRAPAYIKCKINLHLHVLLILLACRLGYPLTLYLICYKTLINYPHFYKRTSTLIKPFLLSLENLPLIADFATFSVLRLPVWRIVHQRSYKGKSTEWRWSLYRNIWRL